MLRLKNIIVLLFVSFAMNMYAQNPNLADQYFNIGEYDKAAPLYLKLFDNRNMTYYQKYVDCLLAMEEYDQAEKSVADELKKRPNDLLLYLTLGNIKERKSDIQGANIEYKRANANLSKNRSEINSLGQAFMDLGKFDLAIETYRKGEELLEEPGLFANNLADLYNRKGDTKKRITQDIIPDNALELDEEIEVKLVLTEAPPPPPPPLAGELIYKVVDPMPRFPGCEDYATDAEKKKCSDEQLVKYIYKNMKYPAIAREKGVKGVVVLQFVVVKDGSIAEVNLLRDIGSGCGEAAVEVVKSMNNMDQKWVPGKLEGRPVNVYHTLPVKFK